MPNFGDMVQKALYLGIGIASYAGERAGETLSELRVQAQKLADEMVARGEMNAEEARRFVDDLVEQAQKKAVQEQKTSSSTASNQPRRIEIISDEEENEESGTSAQESPENVDVLRQQVESLQEELRRLKRQ